MNHDQVSAKLSHIQSKNLETVFSLGEAALENTQKLVELNYDASKNALLHAQDNIQHIITAKDPETGVMGTTTLTVSEANLISYSLSPVNPTVTLGTDLPITATGTFGFFP